MKDLATKTQEDMLWEEWYRILQDYLFARCPHNFQRCRFSVDRDSSNRMGNRSTLLFKVWCPALACGLDRNNIHSAGGFVSVLNCIRLPS